MFGEAHWEAHSFDFKSDPPRIDQRLAKIMNASNPDLARFARRGGKLIHYHGFSDPDIPPRSSINYYEAVAHRMGGGNRLDSFYRLFMVPGMGHCGGGPGANTFDTLPALEEWVERGHPPQRILATKYVDDDPAKTVVRTHPLCSYPQTAQYTGTGSTSEAANFECRL